MLIKLQFLIWLLNKVLSTIIYIVESSGKYNTNYFQLKTTFSNLNLTSKNHYAILLLNHDPNLKLI